MEASMEAQIREINSSCSVRIPVSCLHKVLEILKLSAKTEGALINLTLFLFIRKNRYFHWV